MIRGIRRQIVFFGDVYEWKAPQVGCDVHAGRLSGFLEINAPPDVEDVAQDFDVGVVLAILTAFFELGNIVYHVKFFA